MPLAWRMLPPILFPCSTLWLDGFSGPLKKYTSVVPCCDKYRKGRIFWYFLYDSPTTLVLSPLPTYPALGPPPPWFHRLLSLKKIKDDISDTHCSFDRLPLSIGMKVVMSCSWVNYFVIASSSFLTNILRTCFDLYCIMIMPRICRSCSSTVIFLPWSAVWMWISPCWY